MKNFNLILLLTLAFTTQAHAQSAAKVKILEFGDFECPYTERAIAIVNQITTTYGAAVEVDFKNFPLVKIHPNAKSAALASICAEAQDQYQAMFNLLFANQTKLGQTEYDALAESLNLNLPAFDACMTSVDAEQNLDADITLGNTDGVTATPTFILSNGVKTVKMVGAQPFSAFKKQIDVLLATAP